MFRNLYLRMEQKYKNNSEKVLTKSDKGGIIVIVIELL